MLYFVELYSLFSLKSIIHMLLIQMHVKTVFLYGLLLAPNDTLQRYFSKNAIRSKQRMGCLRLTLDESLMADLLSSLFKLCILYVRFLTFLFSDFINCTDCRNILFQT